MSPLSELHDIVPAESAHWWPIPWGYWVITVAVLIAIVSVFYWRYQNRQCHRVTRAALAEIPKHQASLSALNSVAKRAALQIWSNEEVSTLQGSDWHRFLIDTMPDEKQEAFATRIQPFGQLMYKPASTEVLAEYADLMQEWLLHGLPKRNPRRRPHV